MKQHPLLKGLMLPAVLLLWQVDATDARAQVIGGESPSHLAPKTETPRPASEPAVGNPQPAANPEDETVLVENLQGIVIVKTREEIKEAGVTNVTGLQVVDIPLLQGDDLKATAEKYLNRKATISDIRRLQNDIILLCRSKNHPLVDVILPPQVLDSGVIQLWFLEGKVANITVENKDRRWFADDYMRQQIRLRPMEALDLQELREDLDWANRNPFRQVNVVFKAGKELGQSDMVLNVEDRMPFRAYAGYENTGTPFTGEDRLLAGFNWGNVFGLDQQFNYQYTTDIDFSQLSAHSASYLVPLPWRHNVAVFGAYADATADFTDVDSTAVSEGISYQISMRYAIPRRVSKNYLHELSMGFDYKRTDNDLIFGGTTTSETAVEVAQFQIGYSGLLLDHWGQTSFGLEGYFSPGDMTPANNDEDYAGLRPGSEATYFYARLTAERITRLPRDFSWMLRASGQISTARLTPSEEMGLGGYGTVRGYVERSANGDDGWLIVNEFRTPAFRIGNLLDPKEGLDRLQFLAFLDYGAVSIKDYSETDEGSGLEELTSFASVGAGLRYTVSRNFTFRFDYGFQLINKEENASSGMHVGALLSF